MPKAEGEHLAAVSLGAKDYTSIGEPERHVAVSFDQLANAREVFLAALEGKTARFEIQEKAFECPGFETFYKVGDLGHNPGQYQIVTVPWVDKLWSSP